jgi:nucleotide-binding universal stress UspA family protein
MNTLERIVVATDFSQAATHAVQRAALLAQQGGAALHLLHVVYPLDLYPGQAIAAEFLLDEQALQAESGNRLDLLATLLREQFGIAVEAATRIGRAYTEIANYAVTKAVDLIVVGARGENPLLDLLLGSTTSRLLRVASCPVLIVKNTQTTLYRQVIAAMDMSPESTALPACARAVAPDAAIEALFIFDARQAAAMNANAFEKYRASAQADAEKRLDAMVSQLGDAHVTQRILAGYPATRICEQASDLHADLIVLGRHGKSGLEHWLLGSVSKDVSQTARCDVLIMSLYGACSDLTLYRCMAGTDS